MAAVKYLIRGKSNPSKITLQFSAGRGFTTKITTPLEINPKHFSQAQQKVRNLVQATNKDFINNQLRKLKDHILDEYNMAISEGMEINTAWIKDTLNAFFNRTPKQNNDWKIFLLDYSQRFIDNAPGRYTKKGDNESQPITPGTVQKFKTLKKILSEFSNLEGKRFKLKDIDLQWYKRFVEYMRHVRKYGDNNAGKYISSLKTILNEAMMDGLPVTPKIKKFTVLKAATKDVYLTDAEIDKIFNHNFNDNLRLKNARDLFIIGLRTGLRVGDFTRLNDATIDGDFITIETSKWAREVTIPIHPQLKTILEKGLPHSISGQRLNDYIKEICKEIGFTEKVEGAKMDPETKRKVRGIYPKWQLISTHTCRRSFASNLYGKIPNATIMKITGHSKESNFLKYIKITPKENAMALKAYWDKIMTDQGYKPTMKAVSP